MSRRNAVWVWVVVVLIMFGVDGVAVGGEVVPDHFYSDPTMADHWGCNVQPKWLAENLKLTHSDNFFKFMLGDRPVSVGLTNANVAGLELSTTIDKQWSVAAFGGVPNTPVTEKGVIENLVYGGRIDAHPVPGDKIGLSARINNGQAYADEAATDFSIRLGSLLTVNGLSTYKACEWRKHRYSVRFRYESLQLTPVYEYLYARDDADRFTAESYLFGFAAASDPVRIAGSDLEWKGLDSLSVGLRARRYDYASRHEESLYYAGMVSLKAPAGGHIGLEIGRMQGHLAETLYTLVDADMVCPNLFGLKNAFFSVDARYVDYDRPVGGRDMALHASWGVGVNFLDGRLETKLSGVYGVDPFLADDLGAMLSIKFQP